MSQPTKKQLAYLHSLGYRGTKPLTKGEASAALDVTTESGDQAEAERALIHYRNFTTPSPLPSNLKGCLGSLVLLGGCIAWMRSGGEAPPRPAPPAITTPEAAPIQPPPEPIRLESPVAKPPEPTPEVTPQEPEPEKPEEPARPDEVIEKHANGALTLAKQYIKIDRPIKAAETLQRLIQDYPKTKAAEDAKALLRSIDRK